MTKNILLALTMLAIGAGCTASSTGANNAAATGGSANDAGTTQSAPGGLGCNDILACVAKCSADDKACADACIAKGSPDGKGKANALGQCIEKNQCADSSCVKASCNSELTACVNSKTATSGAPAAQGSLPAELVGRWFGRTEGYELHADGTIIHSIEVTTGTCHTKTLDTGVAVVNGSSMTVSLTSGSVVICDAPKAYEPSTHEYTWSIETGKQGVDGPYDALTLVDTHCTQEAFYCSSTFDRAN